MASSMFISLSRRHSSQLTKPFFSSSISSHLLAKNTQLESSANFTPATPNQSHIFQTQPLANSKPTNVCHSFLQSYLNHGSKNLNLVRSASFSTFHGDLKVKETTLPNTQFKNPKPRNFSSFSNRKNPKENLRKKSNSDKPSAFANKAIEESKIMSKNLSFVFKHEAGTYIVLLVIGSFVSFAIKATPLEENYKIVSFFQHTWAITQVLGLGKVIFFGLGLMLIPSFTDKMKALIEEFEEKRELNVLFILRMVKTFDIIIRRMVGRILDPHKFLSFGVQSFMKLMAFSFLISLFQYVFGYI